MSSARPRGCGAAIRDIVRGAVLGDFARDMGLLGAITLAVLGFVPVIGTLGAIRDVFANWRVRDGIGVLLNVLAVFPVIGGFPKTLEVIRGAHRIGRAYVSARQRSNNGRAVPSRR